MIWEQLHRMSHVPVLTFHVVFENITHLFYLSVISVSLRPTCSRTGNHPWRGSHRNARSPDLLFCSFDRTARVWTKPQPWYRRPGLLLWPKHAINAAARTQEGTVCRSLTSTSRRSAVVATSGTDVGTRWRTWIAAAREGLSGPDFRLPGKISPPLL